MRTSIIVLAVTVSSIAASCAPPTLTAGLGVAEAGSAAFFEGKLQGAIRRELPAVFEATNKAFKELAYEINVSDLKERSAEVTARESNDGRLIDVTLRQSSMKVTIIEIRVGIFGDQQISRLVMAQIIEELGPNTKHQPPIAPIVVPAGTIDPILLESTQSPK